MHVIACECVQSKRPNPKQPKAFLHPQHFLTSFQQLHSQQRYTRPGAASHLISDSYLCCLLLCELRLFSIFFIFFHAFRVILNEGMTLGMTLRSAGPESRSSLVRMHPLDVQKPVELTNTDAVAT